MVFWLEEKGLWGLVITLIVLMIISLTYTVEKRYEAQKSGNVYGYYSRLEFPLIDLRHRLLYDPDKVDDDIVVVTITETALERYKSDFGRWPWPRDVVARLVQYLGEADSLLIDIGFMEPSGREVDPRTALRMRKLVRTANKLKNRDPETASKYLKSVDQQLQRYATAPDQQLGNSLSKNGPAYTATWFVDVAGGELPDAKRKKMGTIASNFGFERNGSDGILPTFSYATPPIDPIIENSQGLAHISFTPDPDGPARRFSPFIGLNLPGRDSTEVDQSYLPILGLAGALEDRGITPGNGSFRVTQDRIEVGDWSVPLDRKNKILIRYKGGLKPRDSQFSSYREIPVETIIDRIMGEGSEGAPDPEFFRGKKVFIGSTASGAHDLRATPFSAQEAGVVVHANILDMFLNNDFLHPIETTDTLLSVVLWTVAVGLIATVFSPLVALVMTLLLTILLIIMGFGLFNQGYLINLSAPLLSSYLTYALITVYNLTFEQRKRRQMRNAFESYLATSVLEEVLEDPDALELGGERREITVMFADISGFTSFSEGRTATEVASVIGKVMTALTECVFRYEGVLDKYIGDELVAEFGIVPGEPGEHQLRAVEAACDMIARLNDLQEQWRKEGREVLDLRIGVHTGPAATGNMGSEMLFDYTAIGDNVNLGSRLEGANKKYGTRCMISDETYSEVKELVEVRELDKIIVKGREEPVTVFQLLGRKGEVDKEILELRDRFDKALERYRNRDWGEAIERFRKINEEYPDDEPTRVLLERAQKYRDDPPSEDWDGTFRLTSK